MCSDLEFYHNDLSKVVLLEFLCLQSLIPIYQGLEFLINFDYQECAGFEVID
jgi:hypothetical protein